MRPKQFMSQYEHAAERSAQLLQRLEWLEAQKTSMQQLIDGMPHGSGRSDLQGKLLDLIIEVDDLREAAAEDLEILIGIRKEVEAVIERVRDPRLSHLLFQRYICHKTWMQIAADMGRMFKPDQQTYSEHWMIDLHSEALREVGKILDAQEKK